MMSLHHAPQNELKLKLRSPTLQRVKLPTSVGLLQLINTFVQMKLLQLNYYSTVVQPQMLTFSDF